MGRLKTPITHEGPQATFALELRTLRISCGLPTYRAMAERAHISHTALSLADRGEKLPTWAVTEAYLRGCGVVDPWEIKRWRDRYESTRVSIDLRNRTMLRSTIGPHAPGPASKAAAVRLLPTLGHRGQLDADRLSRVFSAADLVTALNDLVRRQDWNLAELSRRINDTSLPRIDPARPWHYLSTTEVRRALAGTTLPPRDLVVGIVNACGGSTADVEAWTQTWRRLNRDQRRAQARLDELVQQAQAEAADQPAPLEPRRPGAPLHPGTDGNGEPAMLKPVELLHVQDSGAATRPVPADYQQAARQLAPLIDRLANGDTLTVRQLADIGLNGWRLLDGLLNTPYDAVAEPANALVR